MRDEDRRRFFVETSTYDRSNFWRNSIVSVAGVTVIFVCWQLILGGELSKGQIVFASMLTERLFNSCFMMGGIYDRIMDVIEPVNIVSQLLAEPESVCDPAQPMASPRGPVRIEIREMSYVYASAPEDM